jgi:hypothetical protein
MARKKKAKKKSKKKSKATPRKKITPAKKTTMKRKAPTKSARKKEVRKKTAVKRKAIGQTTPRQTRQASRNQVQETGQTTDAAFSAVGRARALSGQQSGDLQGVSRAEAADSESVDELLEEGNPFEAGIVTGVENADHADEQEVRTHEVPEDDVPDEYLDKE